MAVLYSLCRSWGSEAPFQGCIQKTKKIQLRAVFWKLPGANCFLNMEERAMVPKNRTVELQGGCLIHLEK